MSVTEKLLRVFRADQSLKGLQSRLHAAERFLAEQERQLASLTRQVEALRDQARQLRASAAEQETEIAALDERIAKLRERMNSAATNREYKATLTELNTVKADRDGIETAALEQITRVDDVKTRLAALEAQLAERQKVRDVAAQDRDAKADEIKDRVAELKRERSTLAGQVSADALAVYEELVRLKGDEAMAAIEEQNRRAHEYTCGACMMTLPVETFSALLAGATLTRCVSCGCILYVEKELAATLTVAKR